MNMHTELVNCRRDLELLCKGVYDVIITEVPKWLYHTCSTSGCAQRFAVLDGNEKLTRTMCSAPQCKVKIPSTGISVMSVCPNTPELGGNHHQASKYSVHTVIWKRHLPNPRPWNRSRQCQALSLESSRS